MTTSVHVATGRLPDCALDVCWWKAVHIKAGINSRERTAARYTGTSGQQKHRHVSAPAVTSAAYVCRCVGLCVSQCVCVCLGGEACSKQLPYGRIQPLAGCLCACAAA